MTRNNSKYFYFILLLSIAFANTSVIFTRNALSYNAPPLVIAFYRVFFTSLIILPFVYLKKFLTKPTKEEAKFSILGSVFMCCHFLCYFTSIKYTNAFISTITGAIQPIIVAILSYILYKEIIKRSSMLGMAVAILGIIYIGILSFFHSNEATSFIGFVYSMMTALFFCFYMTCSRGALKTMNEYNFLMILFGSCSIILFIIMLITKTSFFGYEKEMYINCFGLTFFCTILGHCIFNIAVKYTSATYVSVMNLTGPIFATLNDYIFFNQKITTFQCIGGIIIIIGVFLFLKYQNENHNKLVEELNEI